MFIDLLNPIVFVVPGRN